VCCIFCLKPDLLSKLEDEVIISMCLWKKVRRLILWFFI